jgi:hypothetical protein
MSFLQSPPVPGNQHNEDRVLCSYLAHPPVRPGRPLARDLSAD